MGTSSLIWAEELGYAYSNSRQKVNVLNRISFRIMPGEFVAITGPSGSGKTTLLMLIAGLKSMQKGNLYVLGQDMTRCPPHRMSQLRQSIGFVFQSHHLIEFLTVSQNIQIALDRRLDLSRRFKEKRCKHILHEVGLEDKAHFYPSMLSGGQKQRIAFGRALACDPPLLLADEPTASLDTSTATAILRRVKALAAFKGISTLMVTHDQQAISLADRVLELDHGVISPYTCSG